MSPFLGVAIFLLILVVAAAIFRSTSAAAGTASHQKMLAAPATDGRPVDACTTSFYTEPDSSGQTRYCVRDGPRPPKCETRPFPAIIAANEASGNSRCSRVVWGFGCDKGLLCGLQQGGPNLVSYDTADKIAQDQCGGRQRLSC